MLARPPSGGGLGSRLRTALGLAPTMDAAAWDSVEEALIASAATLGVQAQRRDGQPGLWVGDAKLDSKLLDNAAEQLAVIAGQKPAIRRARKSIANFKLREGQAIGAMVTLRGDRMFEFLDRLISVALPRVRDFKGVSPKAFDGRGNYTMGIREQIIFPEINYDQIEKVKGLNVSIVTTAKNDEHGLALLKAFGVPFRTAA